MVRARRRSSGTSELARKVSQRVQPLLSLSAVGGGVDEPEVLGGYPGLTNLLARVTGREPAEQALPGRARRAGRRGGRGCPVVSFCTRRRTSSKHANPSWVTWKQSYTRTPAREGAGGVSPNGFNAATVTPVAPSRWAAIHPFRLRCCRSARHDIQQIVRWVRSGPRRRSRMWSTGAARHAGTLSHRPREHWHSPTGPGHQPADSRTRAPRT